MTPEELLRQLYDETLVGNAPRVLELTNEGLAMGLGPETLLFEALIPSLEEVGARFERGDFFVPEMLIAGKAMAGALEVLRPLLAETGAADGRHDRDGHGQGRRPRHRQEPRQHHVRGRRLPGHRPRRAGRAGEVRRRDRGAPARHRRLLGVPHHDHADVQGEHQRAGEGRPARPGDRHGRRRPGHPGVRRRGRRRRLRRRRVGRRGPGQGTAAAAARRACRRREIGAMQTPSCRRPPGRS